MRHEARATVIGGGIAGLACAHALARRYGDPQAVVLLEGSTRTGGLIHSMAADGYRVAWAANGFLDNAPHTLALVQSSDSSPSSSRAPARRGSVPLPRRRPSLPTSPLGFSRARCSLPAGRLRVALERSRAQPRPATRRSTISPRGELGTKRRGPGGRDGVGDFRRR
jgi:hypothetical protein